MQRRWLVLLSLLVVMLWWSALGGAQQPRPVARCASPSPAI